MEPLLSLPPTELAARLWEIYPFICCGHARTHPTTHHFYFILHVSHSAGWLNRIMSPTIIINQNYGLKKLRLGKWLTGISSRNSTSKPRAEGGERKDFALLEAVMTSADWQGPSLMQTG